MLKTNYTHILWLTSQFPNGSNNIDGMFIYRSVKELSKHYKISVVVLYPIIPPILPILKNLKFGKSIYSQWLKKFPPNPKKPSGLDKVKVIYSKFIRPPRIKNKSYEGWFAYHSIKNKIRSNKNSKLLIHANWLYPEGLAAYYLSKKMNIPFVLTLRGHDVNSLVLGSRDWRLANIVFKNANKISSVSEELLNQCLEKNLSLNETKKFVTHNFYEFAKFIILDKKQIRQKLLISSNTLMIFTVGNLSKRKNIDLLIKSIPKLLLKGLKVSLYIAGFSYEFDNLNKLTKDMMLTDTVHFLGKLDADDLVNYYNAADVFCLPSKSEGLPNVIVESLLCGTSVVASAVNEIPKIIKNEINGNLIEPNSLNSLVDGLIKNLSQSWDRNKIRESVSFLSTKNILVEYKNFYNG